MGDAIARIIYWFGAQIYFAHHFIVQYSKAFLTVLLKVIQIDDLTARKLR